MLPIKTIEVTVSLMRKKEAIKAVIGISMPKGITWLTRNLVKSRYQI